MFYEGDLSSGISLAIQQSKSVVCFVKDDGEESRAWEQEWLQDANVPHALNKRAVTLRIEAGSQEAGYLTAFCPISVIPTIVIIRQGQLQDQINGGVNKNDFTLRLMRAINPNVPRPPAPTETNQPITTAATIAQSRPTEQSLTSSTATSNPVPSNGPPTHSPAQESPTPPSVQRDPNRDKRRKPPDDPDTPTSPPPAAPRPSRRTDEAYAREQVQRKKEAQSERDRVRRLVEADRIERRRIREEQEQRRSLAYEEEKQAQAAQSSSASAASQVGSFCNLQVRLADGSNLRGRFGPDDTIQNSVRSWIDRERRDGSVPYTLKLIRTPKPSKPLSDDDEAQTLRELGLLPSATLMLVPIRTFTGAYQAGGTQGFMRGLPSLIGGYAFAILAWLFGFLNDFIRLGIRAMRGNIEHQERRDAGEIPSPPPRDRRGQTTSSTTSSSDAEPPKPGIRIRTLRDQRDGQNDQQFYNGNQLNFEPNKKDDDDSK